MLSLKSDVRSLGVKPEALLAILIAYSVYQRHGKNCVITSIVDGKHSRGSIHYAGYAFDLRTRHLTEEELGAIALDLQEALGQDYDVVIEPNHIHVEYQPKNPY
jgi:hypothetical protein